MRVVVELEITEKQITALREMLLECPRGSNMIDIVVRRQGFEKWHDADWLYEIATAVARQAKP